MINSPLISTFAFLALPAGPQAITEGLIVSPMEATDAWVDDCIALLVLGY